MQDSVKANAGSLPIQNMLFGHRRMHIKDRYFDCIICSLPFLSCVLITASRLSVLRGLGKQTAEHQTHYNAYSGAETLCILLCLVCKSAIKAVRLLASKLNARSLNLVFPRRYTAAHLECRRLNLTRSLLFL